MYQCRFTANILLLRLVVRIRYEARPTQLLLLHAGAQTIEDRLLIVLTPSKTITTRFFNREQAESATIGELVGCTRENVSNR